MPADAQEILDHLGCGVSRHHRLVRHGRCRCGVSSNVEYFDEPAMALMLCELPADQYRVFSGVSPL
jgi:hypothetical protein